MRDDIQYLRLGERRLNVSASPWSNVRKTIVGVIVITLLLAPFLLTSAPELFLGGLLTGLSWPHSQPDDLLYEQSINYGFYELWRARCVIACPKNVTLSVELQPGRHRRQPSRWKTAQRTDEYLAA